VHQLIGIANLNQLFSEIFILQVNVDNRVNRANRADRFSCVENRANSHHFRLDVVYPRRGGHSGGGSRAGRGGISFAITASLPQARSGAALLFATARSLVESRPPHACGEIWVACLAIRLAAFDTPGIIPNAQLEGRSLSCRVIDV
jgi:hypothetical protein